VEWLYFYTVPGIDLELHFQMGTPYVLLLFIWRLVLYLAIVENLLHQQFELKIHSFCEI